MPITKQQQRRGFLADLPTLDDGEIGLAQDTGQVFIGNIGTNIELTGEADLGTPLVDGYHLSSTVGGVRSWVAGFTDPMTTRGDIVIRDALNISSRLGIGTIGQILTSDGADISWALPAIVPPFNTVANVTSNSPGDVTLDDLVFGSETLNSTDIPVAEQSRMMFDKSKGAFRVGTTTGTQWDDTNRGVNSLAWGLDATASGAQATAFGENTVADGAYSAVWGQNNNALGDYSVAFGFNVDSTGVGSISMGQDINNDGPSSIAMGGGITIDSTASDSAGFGLDSGQPFTISDPNVLIVMRGNVGLETVSPQERLHVVGSVLTENGGYQTTDLIDDDYSIATGRTYTHFYMNLAVGRTVTIDLGATLVTRLPTIVGTLTVNGLMDVI